jgi:endo-1,4-beta-xylanase
VNNTPIKTWTLTNSYADYTASTSASGDMQVEYTNDQNGGDTQIDYLSINGQVRQSEAQTYNTGVWGNGSCGGGSKSEWLHCNGAIGYGKTQ